MSGGYSFEPVPNSARDLDEIRDRIKRRQKYQENGNRPDDPVQDAAPVSAKVLREREIGRTLTKEQQLARAGLRGAAKIRKTNPKRRGPKLPDEERRARRIALNKAMWADPVLRARMSAKSVACSMTEANAALAEKRKDPKWMRKFAQTCAQAKRASIARKKAEAGNA